MGLFRPNQARRLARSNAAIISRRFIDGKDAELNRLGPDLSIEKAGDRLFVRGAGDGLADQRRDR